MSVLIGSDKVVCSLLSVSITGTKNPKAVCDVFDQFLQLVQNKKYILFVVDKQFIEDFQKNPLVCSFFSIVIILMTKNKILFQNSSILLCIFLTKLF